jgi:acetyl-CoA/propionyl-CoA carboxylase biotin carboxyl carrier protein
MFSKLLVANRGEIAVRVMRGCRDLGIATVAVFSDLDVEAVHTRFADEAYNVGPGPAAQSYLNIDAILQAAKRSGAEAVHPGYGFLAENASFAQAVTDAGLTWVGPSAEVIDAMGDKVAARRAATGAGVATVPGTPQPVTSASEVEAFAAEHGLPIAIKASAGGGGKGFRVVADLASASEALSGAAREALAYFSSPDVYLERYLQRPRHIEIQVLGDASGAIVSFPERDCSLQRRHQKLIEESPSPALEPKVREAIMEAAARVSKQVGYRNAGTCEFLLDADGTSFYFLEMNTRLQVEHPVTELVTSTDLVVAQLLIAAGEPLPFSQDDIELRGHAIECRVNAEDAARGFMPSPGTIGEYREPGGPGVRVDSGMVSGATVSQAYDPLVSKLITFGAHRDEARRRMLRALSEYTIEGLRTSIPFHELMLQDERFISGDYHTGTVENELDLSILPVDAEDEVDVPEQTAQRHLDLELEGKRFEVVVRERSRSGTTARKPTPPQRSGKGQAGGGEVLSAPMQGTIVKVSVEVGDTVSAGAVVCILEAMKMENSILAHSDGTIAELPVRAGQSVEAGATVAVIR